MSDVRKVERPTRAKVNPLAEATKKWNAERLVPTPKGFLDQPPTRNWIGKKEADAKNMSAPPQALNHAAERDKSPIEAALECLESATHILNGCISELQLRLVAVLLQSTQIADIEHKPTNCPMEDVILDRCDDVLASHDRLRGIIERLQL